MNRETDAGWVDFILSKIGLMLFAVFILIAVAGIYPSFSERREAIALENLASGIASKITEVAKSSISGNPYNLTMADSAGGNYTLEISSEYVSARDAQRRAAVNLIMKVYPLPVNSTLGDEKSLREYLASKYGGDGTKNGTIDLSSRENVRALFDGLAKEASASPYVANRSRPLTIEKIEMNYGNGEVDTYVIVYQ
jgi:hypothetical protein